MKNLRMFEVKYLGQTDRRGSRIKIRDTRFERFVTFSYDSSAGDSWEQAYNYLQDRNIAILFHSWDEKTGLSYLFTEDFEKELKP